MKYRLQAFQLLFTFYFLLFTFVSFSQSPGVGINSSGAPADNSAMLDIMGTGKGFLVPRMSTANRPSDPVESLLIYNTDTHCFEAYYNNAWVAFGCLSCKLPDSPTSGKTNLQLLL